MPAKKKTVDDAEAQKIDEQKERDAQAGKPDAPYDGDGENHASYMEGYE